MQPLRFNWQNITKVMIRDAVRLTGQNIKLIKQSLPTISSLMQAATRLTTSYSQGAGEVRSTDADPHSEHRFPAPSSLANSARFSYAIEGALFISAQLSIDSVSALRKVRVLILL